MDSRRSQAALEKRVNFAPCKMVKKRGVDFEGITSLEYNWPRWYDHWWVLFRLRGSIWPLSILTVLCSVIAATLYHYLLFDHEPTMTYITNPTIFAFYMQTAGIVLAFMTSICYGRYWEGLTSLCQMGQSLINLTSLALSFERDQDLVIEGLNGVQWKAQVVHTTSLLHATCISVLKSDEYIIGRPLDVFGGMTLDELQELARVEDQSALVLFWLQDLLASRLSGGGMAVKAPPVVAQVWTCLVTFANAFAACKRIAQFPLPLPLHHCLAFSDIFVTFLAPYIIAAFTPNLALCLLIVFATSLAYHGLFMVNILALQQPFGCKTYHLPLAMLHRQVIKGLVSLVTQDIAEELVIFFNGKESSGASGSGGGTLGGLSNPHPGSNIPRTASGLGNSQNASYSSTTEPPRTGIDPNFVFPPVDSHYISGIIDKRHRHPGAVAASYQQEVQGSIPLDHPRRFEPRIPIPFTPKNGGFINTTTIHQGPNFSPVLNSNVLNTTKHPALSKYAQNSNA